MLQTALRARIVLRAAEGAENAQIATELHTSRVTVGLWRSRFLDLGLPGLETLPRPGRPRSLPGETVRRVITEVVRPPSGHARWSRRTMAKAVGIS
ncbi:MAG: helix-turn-helix domain-containing protein, partial [Verrucomicrobiae bacterium]|nr:helix-turn-helix domain-containing protein [Verrucomicrobiae bacterium]